MRFVARGVMNVLARRYLSRRKDYGGGLKVPWPRHSCLTLKQGLRLLKLDFNNLVVFFQVIFLAKTLVMLSRDQ